LLAPVVSISTFVTNNFLFAYVSPEFVILKAFNLEPSDIPAPTINKSVSVAILNLPTTV
jgi:hypothetical protein